MRILKIALIIICVLLTQMSFARKVQKYDYLYKNLPFSMSKIQKPLFPNYSVSVTECGGVGDGITLNTKAFAEAMSRLSVKGGGTLLVPYGVWFTGPIEFKSNVNLHLEKGAIIIFTPDVNAYPLIKTSFEGLETRRCQSPISGKNLTNIAITGQGAINGSGEHWRPLKKAKVTELHWKSVVKSGGMLKTPDYWVPGVAHIKGEAMSDKNLVS